MNCPTLLQQIMCVFPQIFEVRIISRWEPTSQKCSCCGFNGGKKELKVHEWQCLNCGTVHDRDINASINIKVADGLLETKNGRGGSVRLSLR